MSTNSNSAIGWRVPPPTLEGRVRQVPRMAAVEKNQLLAGDEVIVTTLNSVYSIQALGDGQFLVSGGWFDRQGDAPQCVTINGCTWGGTAIKQDIVAAPGLFLEFGNGVTTTRIRSVRVILAESRSSKKPC